MTGKAPYIKKLFDFLAGHKFSVVIFLVLLFLGYNMTLSGIQQCNAAPTTGMPVGTNPPAQPPVTNQTVTVVAPGSCPGPCPFSGAPCEVEGTSFATAITLDANSLKGYLVGEGANNLETWVFDNMDAILTSEYIQLDWLEKSMNYWWDTMWYYNLLPGFQEMTRQLNAELALQVFQLHAYADANAVMETDRAYAKHGIADQESQQPAEQVCVAATEMSGFTRATVFSRAMREAWELKSVAAGLNEKTDPDGNPNPGATSSAGLDKQRYSDWQNIFCDANGNGKTDLHCGGNVDANLINMDVLPVKYLFNNLTINVNDTTQAANGSTEGKNLELGLEYLINNLVGLPAMEAIPLSAVSTVGGEAGYLLRRSYLARYAAIRSVPDMIAGWRMPGSSPQGSQMGAWIKDLRESGGAPANLMEDTNDGVGGFNTKGLVLAGGISKNPSYKEIMHALSIDRFNSGRYANEMITDPSKVDLEKLDVSVFYLMQLRDYYELLERTALTLAVQVSLLADQQVPGSQNAAAPMNAPPTPGG